MKINLLLLILLAAITSQAQTKVIAHKSHSGSAKTFNKAYNKNLFGARNGSFGLPNTRSIIVLDSVIAINDSITILKIRESKVCVPFGTDYKKMIDSEFARDSISLLNDAVFRKKNTVAYIKNKVYNAYNLPIYFANSALENVVFIGFKE
jgi:hypothetical protein